MLNLIFESRTMTPVEQAHAPCKPDFDRILDVIEVSASVEDFEEDLQNEYGVTIRYSVDWRGTHHGYIGMATNVCNAGFEYHARQDGYVFIGSLACNAF
jgi:hypothetical protein